LPEISRLLAAQNIALAFGGRIFTELPTLKDHILGYYLGDNFETAVEVVEQALRTRQMPPQRQTGSQAYLESLAHFQEQQAEIELTTWQYLKELEIPEGQAVHDNLYLARNIVAALKLGDMKFLGSEITWIEGLMNNYGLDANYLPAYLDAYYKAAKQHLDR
jgi:hypothetical protein